MSAPRSALLSDLTFRPPPITQRSSCRFLIPFWVEASRRVSSGSWHQDPQYPFSLLSPLRYFFPLRAAFIQALSGPVRLSPVPLRGPFRGRSSQDLWGLGSTGTLLFSAGGPWGAKTACRISFPGGRLGAPQDASDYGAILAPPPGVDMQKDLPDSIPIDSFVASLVGRTSLVEDVIIRDSVDKKVDVAIKKVYLGAHMALQRGLYSTYVAQLLISDMKPLYRALDESSDCFWGARAN
ncbi:hypothetical protein NDU88_001633 [Pleurodeles waltl]|uniref:Uncharacterized protein n=1 Tax=Pleurodeles waltl TaxID=8319 RepID=A0AAV7M5V2_PLEWA|nr:hypothetical protein NDU88_001633 [Pleurodeles waltl]